jgi:hypothetical protein
MLGAEALYAIHDTLYALLLFCGLCGELVGIAGAYHKTRFGTICWADNTALFEHVHEFGSACIADAEFALQI